MGAVSLADAALLAALRAALPDGWKVEIGEVNEEDPPEMLWWALVCRRKHHLDYPRLLINRAAENVEVCLTGLADGFWGTTTRDTLAEAIEVVRRNLVFYGDVARLGAAQSEAGADVRH